MLSILLKGKTQAFNMQRLGFNTNTQFSDLSRYAVQKLKWYTIYPMIPRSQPINSRLAVPSKWWEKKEEFIITLVFLIKV